MSFNTIDTSFATHALALSVQQWMDLGRGKDPLTGTPSDPEEAALRITNILIVRLIAVQHPHRFTDLATSTIARAVLEEARNWSEEDGGDGNHNNSNGKMADGSLMAKITPSLTLQLETYVTCILYGYNNNLPFHNFQHAYHVCCSANKFIESMLLTTTSEPDTSSSRYAYGLSKDPLSLMALLFAALIHDTGHTGVSNLQRAKDEPDLLQQYGGDASIHEHHSLKMAFDELIKDEYDELRTVMFPEPLQQQTFQALVHSAVLSTDIASPVRAEEAKNKYFEAFPITLLDESHDGMDDYLDDDYYDDEDEFGGGPGKRRSSMASNISMPRAAAHHQNSINNHQKTTSTNRKGSMQTVSSIHSDITMDSYSMMKHQNKVSRNMASALQSRRASNGSAGGGSLGVASASSAHNNNDNGGLTTPKQRRVARRHSIETVDSHYSEFAADSIRMTREKPDGGGVPQRRASATGVVPQRRLSASHSTDTGLIGLAHERRRDSMKGSMLSQESEFSEAFGRDSMKLAHSKRLAESSGGAGAGDKGGGKTGTPMSRSRRSPDRAKRTNSMDLVGAELGGEQDEYDGDSSLSLTPPSSDDEMDGVVISGVTTSKIGSSSNANDKAEADNQRIARRLSNGGGSPAKILSIKEETAGEFNDTSGHLGVEVEVTEQDLEEVSDELRAAVVVELCLRAADVAHWYQSWDLLIHFNRRIFMELCEASKEGRGFDPRPNWFDNQAKIMETYLLPLAQQIEFVGVFNQGSGIDLVASLESNNDMWLIRGFDVVEALKAEADK